MGHSLLAEGATMRWIGCSLLCAVVASSPCGAEPPPGVWTATGKWTVEHADRRCLASRTFAAHNKSLVVVLAPTPASDAGQLWLLTEDARLSLDRVRIDAGGVAVKAEGMTLAGLTASKQRVWQMALQGEEMQRLWATGRLGLRGPDIEAALFLPALNQVRPALQGCTEGLLKDWGFPAETARLTTFAKPREDVVAYVRAEDYPSAALRDGASGTAEVMVTVGVDGRARDCRVLQSAGHPALDSTTCAIVVRRARFEPAREASGKAVEAPFFTRISWRMH